MPSSPGPVGPLAVTIGDKGDLAALPAWRLAELVASRDVLPTEITEAVLAKIDRLDPQVRAFRTVAAQAARQQARAADVATLRAIGPFAPRGTHHGDKDRDQAQRRGLR